MAGAACSEHRLVDVHLEIVAITGAAYCVDLSRCSAKSESILHKFVGEYLTEPLRSRGSVRKVF